MNARPEVSPEVQERLVALELVPAADERAVAGYGSILRDLTALGYAATDVATMLVLLEREGYQAAKRYMEGRPLARPERPKLA